MQRKWRLRRWAVAWGTIVPGCPAVQQVVHALEPCKEGIVFRMPCSQLGMQLVRADSGLVQEGVDIGAVAREAGRQI